MYRFRNEVLNHNLAKQNLYWLQSLAKRLVIQVFFLTDKESRRSFITAFDYGFDYFKADA